VVDIADTVSDWRGGVQQYVLRRRSIEADLQAELAVYEHRQQIAHGAWVPDRFGGRGVELRETQIRSPDIQALKEVVRVAAHQDAFLADEVFALTGAQFEALFEHTEKLLQAIEERLVTPVQTFHLLALYIAFEKDMPDFLQAARQRIELLCHPEHGVAYCEGFLAILKWASFRLGWRPETNDWPPHLKLRATWVHAARLHQAFCIYRADPKFTLDWFTGNSQEFSCDSLSPKAGLSGDAAFPGNVFFLAFVLRGLAYGIARAADGSEVLVAARASASRLVNTLATNFRMAYPLLRRLDLGSNCLGSFLGEDKVDSLSHLFGAESYGRLFCTPKDALQAALSRLEQNPQDLDAWVRLDSLLGGALVPAPAAPVLEQAVRRQNLAALFARDQNRGTLLALFGAKYAGKVGSPETKQFFFDQLVGLARVASETQVKTKVRIEDDESLLRLAAIFPTSVCELYAQPDTGGAVVMKCEQMLRILAVWTPVATIVGTALDDLMRKLPIQHQRAYWPLSLILRALC